jgi:hypothetical protein
VKEESMNTALFAGGGRYNLVARIRWLSLRRWSDGVSCLLLGMMVGQIQPCVIAAVIVDYFEKEADQFVARGRISSTN